MEVPYLLFRVDDRLLHGQVTVGWGLRLGPGRYLIVDDEIAEDEVARRLYLAATTEDATTEVVAVAEFLLRAETPEVRAATILLVRSVAVAATLLRAGVPGPLNLGGLHGHPGAAEFLPYVHLDEEERREVLALLDAGVEVEVRDLPESKSLHGVALRRLLAGPA